MNRWEEFHDYLRTCSSIVALVGSGLSVSSGLPTFRDSGGLWKNYNVIDLATPDAFYIDPGLVWQFYSFRRSQALKSQPNKGHIALAKFARLEKPNFLTITQNVDGLSSRANHPDEKLVELHGSLFTLKCTSFWCSHIENNNFEIPLTPKLKNCEFEYDNSKRKRTYTEKEDPDKSTSISPQFTPVFQLEEEDLPHCPVCKEGLLRPGVVWFGESLPLKAVDRIDNFIQESHIDLILVIGTSGSVWPANSYVEKVKLQGGKVAIFNIDIDEDEINKDKNCWGFKGDAAELLPKALEPLIGSCDEL